MADQLFIIWQLSHTKNKENIGVHQEIDPYKTINIESLL